MTRTRRELTRGDAVLIADDLPGPGHTLLYLSGAGQTRTELGEIVEPLLGTCRIVLPDSRGHGESEPGSSHTWSDLVDDACAWIDELGLVDVRIVGTSMGAILQPAVAMARPEQVTRLLITMPVYLGCDVEPEPDHAAALRLLLSLFGESGPVDTDALVAGMSNGDPEAAAVVRERLGRHRSLDAVASYFRADRSAAALPYRTTHLAGVTIPVTVAPGSDPFHPPHVGDQLARLLPNVTLVEPLPLDPAAELARRRELLAELVS